TRDRVLVVGLRFQLAVRQRRRVRTGVTRRRVVRPRAIAELLHELGHHGLIPIELRLPPRNKLTGPRELRLELLTTRGVCRLKRLARGARGGWLGRNSPRHPPYENQGCRKKQEPDESWVW